MPKKLVAYFPGQGSQQIGMLSGLSEQYPVIRQTFEEASEAIQTDLWAISQEGPAEAINLTINTQPVLVTASAAVWRVLQQEAGEDMSCVIGSAGHSVGEYAALHCSGILSLEDAVRLVRTRGELMEKAVPDGQGGMAAIIGLDDEKIAQVCADAASVGVVEPVNFNAPGQIVIAGTAAGIEKACELAKEAGARRAMPLVVSGPFHSSLMKEAATPFVEALKSVEWNEGTFPVYHNADNKPAGIADMPAKLVEQLYSPVNWIGAVSASSEGADLALEVGSGKVITGLNKRIRKDLPTMPTAEPDALAKAVEAIKGLSDD